MHTPYTPHQDYFVVRAGFRLSLQRLLCGGIAALLVTASSLAHAQVREFPAAALRGTLQVSATPPDISLDGKADRLAPGARIRNVNNQLVLSGSLVGQTLRVNYTREATTGLVFDVWLLTEDEAGLPRPNTPKRRWFEFF